MTESTFKPVVGIPRDRRKRYYVAGVEAPDGSVFWDFVKYGEFDAAQAAAQEMTEAALKRRPDVQVTPEVS